MRHRSATIVVSAVMGFFMVFVLASSSFALAASPTPADLAQYTWAYGFVKTVSVSPTYTADGWQYDGSLVIGYAVVITETNTSPTTFELSVHRTMGAAFSVEFCKPRCALPTSSANLTVRAWEDAHAWANFTTQGVVEESHVPVPAIALLNTSSTVKANLTEAAYSVLPSGTGPPVDRSTYLSAAVSSIASASFSPALGLIPLDLAPPASWEAMSAFNASGSWDYSFFFVAHAPLHNIRVGPLTGSGVVQPSGNVSVAGELLSSSEIPFGGVEFPAISLAISGPFSVREGVILLPGDADLFGSAEHPWSGNQSSATTVQMATLDAKPYVNGHFGLEASSWVFASSSSNPGTASDSVSLGSPLVPATTSLNPVATNTIQGAPESVAQADSQTGCLTTGSGCFANAPAPRAVLVALAIGVVVAGVAGLIAAVFVVDRRRLPPPVYPNANLYPPGAARSPPPRPAPRPTQTPPPTEEDPLDHLW
jgi:hypothetical protein